MLSNACLASSSRNADIGVAAGQLRAALVGSLVHAWPPDSAVQPPDPPANFIDQAIMVVEPVAKVVEPKRHVAGELLHRVLGVLGILGSLRGGRDVEGRDLQEAQLAEQGDVARDAGVDRAAAVGEPDREEFLLPGQGMGGSDEAVAEPLRGLPAAFPDIPHVREVS